MQRAEKNLIARIHLLLCRAAIQFFFICPLNFAQGFPTEDFMNHFKAALFFSWTFFNMSRCLYQCPGAGPPLLSFKYYCALWNLEFRSLLGPWPKECFISTFRGLAFSPFLEWGEWEEKKNLLFGDVSSNQGTVDSYKNFALSDFGIRSQISLRSYWRDTNFKQNFIERDRRKPKKWRFYGFPLLSEEVKIIKIFLSESYPD